MQENKPGAGDHPALAKNTTGTKDHTQNRERLQKNTSLHRQFKDAIVAHSQKKQVF